MFDESIDAIIQPDGWRYENVEDERRKMLLSPASFGLLLEQIVANANIGHVVLAEPCEDGGVYGISLHRVAFRLHGVNAVAIHAFDRLLNGVNGLRARYASSGPAGANANGWVCRFLGHAIAAGHVEFADDVDKSSRGALRRQAVAAMAHASARVWFEPTVNRTAPSTAEAKVSCTRWLQSHAHPLSLSRELAGDVFRVTEQQIAFLLNQGATIPVPHALEVKGGFRTRDGREHVPPNERTRELHIHLTGWA